MMLRKLSSRGSMRDQSWSSFFWGVQGRASLDGPLPYTPPSPCEMKNDVYRGVAPLAHNEGSAHTHSHRCNCRLHLT